MIPFLIFSLLIFTSCNKQRPDNGSSSVTDSLSTRRPHTRVPSAPNKTDTPIDLVETSTPESNLGSLPSNNVPALPVSSTVLTKEMLIKKYGSHHPKEWGEKTEGIKTRVNTTEKVIAFTFDACGGPGSSGYDKELIDYLIKEKVPATLFINSRWIDANFDIFLQLSDNDLFEIENHGYQHLPLSVDGKSAYRIAGTKDISQVIDEVTSNQNKIYEITGRAPKFFRPGTAYADEIAVDIVKDLGLEVVGFNVLGDAGATYSKEQIKRACLNAPSGSIIICHMNHPEKQTAEGIIEVIPELRKEGFTFVKLQDYPLQ